jgi:hypothetical protein
MGERALSLVGRRTGFTSPQTYPEARRTPSHLGSVPADVQQYIRQVIYEVLGDAGELGRRRRGQRELDAGKVAVAVGARGNQQPGGHEPVRRDNAEWETV